jgi:hypothetical protein
MKYYELSCNRNREHLGYVFLQKALKMYGNSCEGRWQLIKCGLDFITDDINDKFFTSQIDGSANLMVAIYSNEFLHLMKDEHEHFYLYSAYVLSFEEKEDLLELAKIRIQEASDIANFGFTREDHSNLEYIKYILAKIEYKQKNYINALKILEDCLTINESTRVQYLIGKIKMEIGDNSGIVNLLDSYLFNPCCKSCILSIKDFYEKSEIILQINDVQKRNFIIDSFYSRNSFDIFKKHLISGIHKYEDIYNSYDDKQYSISDFVLWLQENEMIFKSPYIDLEDYHDESSDDVSQAPEYKYGSSYEKYGGYNGFSDDVIDDAFDGDPENTWNVM